MSIQMHPFSDQISSIKSLLAQGSSCGYRLCTNEYTGRKDFAQKYSLYVDNSQKKGDRVLELWAIDESLR